MNAPPNPATSALSISDLRFDWTPDQALIDLPHLSLERGASLLLGGPSGSGKSTLLNLIGGVIPVAQGRISVNGTDLAALSGSQRDRFRAEHLGIIFQQFNLLPFLGVIDNVLLPLRFAPQRRARVGADEASCRRHAQTLLEQLGVPEGRWSAAVRDLSVGQQQRVAAARALINASSDGTVFSFNKMNFDDSVGPRFTVRKGACLNVIFRFFKGIQEAVCIHVELLRQVVARKRRVFGS